MEYTCRTCLGGEAALAEVRGEVPDEAAETQGPVPCSVCGVNLRRGASYATCRGDQSTQKVHRHEKRPG